MHPNNSQTADGSHIDTAEDYDSDDDLPPLVDITDDEDEDEDTGAESSFAGRLNKFKKSPKKKRASECSTYNADSN